MSQQPTYTLIIRDRYMSVVNTITGLSESRANAAVGVLRDGDSPETWELVREPSRVEQLEERVMDWRYSGQSLCTAEELAACLAWTAEQLRPLGDKPIPSTNLSLNLHVIGHESDAESKKALFDNLVDLFCLNAFQATPGDRHYRSKASGNEFGVGGVEIVTILGPELPNMAAIAAEVPDELAPVVA